MKRTMIPQKDEERDISGKLNSFFVFSLPYISNHSRKNKKESEEKMILFRSCSFIFFPLPPLFPPFLFFSSCSSFSLCLVLFFSSRITRFSFSLFSLPFFFSPKKKRTLATFFNFFEKELRMIPMDSVLAMTL